MRLVRPNRPLLVQSQRLIDVDEEATEQPSEAMPDPIEGPRGMAIHLEPERPWKADPNSPWARLPSDLASLGAYSHMAIVSGAHGEAGDLARAILAAAGGLRKTTPIMIRHLYPDGRDGPELEAAAGVFDGFLVPAHPEKDQAISFERTRRRAAALVANSLGAGWNRAPLIVLQPPSADFLERIPEGFCEWLLLDEPAQKRYPVPNIIAPAPKQRPWWATSGNFLYLIQGDTLWYADWMANPLTFEPRGV